MEISYNANQNKLTVSVSGILDTSTSPKLDKALAEIFYSEEISELHFEFGGLDYISSSGLRVLLAALKKLNGGRAYIENANSVVTNILKMTGFDQLFEIVNVHNDEGEGDI
jgi:anti-sigma B factor antagonist